MHFVFFNIATEMDALDLSIFFFHLMQVRVLCEKAKEILMEESNVQVFLLVLLVSITMLLLLLVSITMLSLFMVDIYCSICICTTFLKASGVEKYSKDAQHGYIGISFSFFISLGCATIFNIKHLLARKVLS